MSETAISNLALILLIAPVLLHGIEQLYPTQARWIVNWVLPFFAPMLPKRAAFLSYDDQIAMQDAALAAAPADKRRAAEDYVFVMQFEQRQGAIGFTAVAVGALYGLSLGVVDRDALHLVFGVIAALMMLVNANQAGLPIFGQHPKVSTNGKHVGYVFAPYWAVALALNGLGFSAALGSA